jgi:hypothetical protein
MSCDWQGSNGRESKPSRLKEEFQEPCLNVAGRRNAGAMNCPQKIISDRQAGADRGALDCAIAHGIEHGGIL